MDGFEADLKSHLEGAKRAIDRAIHHIGTPQKDAQVRILCQSAIGDLKVALRVSMGKYARSDSPELNRI